MGNMQIKADEKRKILYVSGNDLTFGGVQGFINKWIREIRSHEVPWEITWFFPGKIIEPVWETMMKDAGVRLVSTDLDIKKNSIIGPEVQTFLTELFRTEKFDIIHCNSGNIAFEHVIMLLAEKNNIPLRIAHSHSNIKKKYSTAKICMQHYRRFWIRKRATVCAGCGVAAGQWLFGKTIEKSGKWKFVPNTIEVGKYKYNEDERRKKRDELGIEDEKYLIGAIGSLSTTKNHLFLISVMEKLVKTDPDCQLVIIGEGELREALESAVSEKKLASHVSLVGNQDDVQNWLQAMDLLVMPSLFEGFSFVSIEAQAAGLPCIFSSSCTREMDIAGDVSFVSLGDADEWVHQIQLYRNNKDLPDSGTRTHKNSVVKEKGFDVSGQWDTICDLYNI